VYFIGEECDQRGHSGLEKQPPKRGCFTVYGFANDEAGTAFTSSAITPLWFGSKDNVRHQQRRRTADAIGVVSWRYHPRERNREARSVMSTVTPAGTEADLSKHTERLGAGHLDPITAQAARDITHWWNRQEQQGTSVSEAATV
jgi:hypothetical protein